MPHLLVRVHGLEQASSVVPAGHVQAPRGLSLDVTGLRQLGNWKRCLSFIKPARPALAPSLLVVSRTDVHLPFCTSGMRVQRRPKRAADLQVGEALSSFFTA